MSEPKVATGISTLHWARMADARQQAILDFLDSEAAVELFAEALPRFTSRGGWVMDDEGARLYAVALLKAARQRLQP